MRLFLQNKLLSPFERIPQQHVGLICLCLIILSYHLLFFNRFFPIQEGWFSVYAHYLNRGAIPYKDFYFFLPPLYPLKIAALNSLFGDSLIVVRVYALFERILLVVLIYRMYLRFATVRSAFFATLFSVFFYTSVTVDVIYSYYQTCLLLGLLASYFLLYAVEKDGRHWWPISLSGVFAGLSFMCKQSTGLFLALAIPIMISFLFFRKGMGRVCRFVVVYVAFFVLAISPFIIWLSLNGAFNDFITQVFFGGIASKGSLLGLLFGFFTITFSVKYLVWYVLLGLLAYKLRAGVRDENITIPTLRYWLAVSLCGVLAIVVPLFVPQVMGIPYAQYAFGYSKGIVINSSFVFVLVYLVWLARIGIMRQLTECEKTLFILFGTSMAVMYAHGLSYALEEHAALPAVGILVCVILDSSNIKLRLRGYVLPGIIIGFMFFTAASRYAMPYGWWGWWEPSISSANTKLDFPEGRSFRVSNYTASILSDIVAVIKNNSAPTDTIYTFPNIPLFYFLTGRYPVTFALVHYFDVCPDWIARADAAKIRASLPKVIVFLDFSERTWQFHETVFRKGGRSGQRAIADVISEITSSQRNLYNLERTYTTKTGEQLKVWVRHVPEAVIE